MTSEANVTRSETQLYFENASDPDNTVLFAEMKGEGINIEVSDEQACDSYNHLFNLNFYLSRDEASVLFDWLKGVLKEQAE